MSSSSDRTVQVVSGRTALFAVALGSLLIPLNSTMVAVALPNIMEEFGIGAGTVSLLVTVYLASVAVSLPFAGHLGDKFGHRRVYLIGVAAFAITSMIAAASWSFSVVIAARILQGVTGSSISPNATTLIREIAPEESRGRSFGFFDMFISASAAIGPFIGGLLVGGFGWRSMFVVAAPIALVSGVLVTAIIPADSGDRHATSSDEGHLTLMLKSFKSVPFASAIAGVLGVTVVLHGLTVTIPIFTQTLLGASPQVSGIIMLPMFAVSALLAPIGGRVSDHLGRRVPAMAGSLVMASGLAALWAGGRSIEVAGVAVFLGLIGIGFGTSGPARQTCAIENVPVQVTGTAASVYLTSRYIGGVIGAAVVGVLLGETATFVSASRAFLTLSAVAIAAAVVSVGLTGRKRRF